MSKKSLYPLLLMLMLLVPYGASASRFYAEADGLERGKTNTIQFILENPGLSVYGFQADVWLPYGVEPVTKDNGELEISLSDRAREGGYSITSNILSYGPIRMGTFSTNKNPFFGDNGVLVNMTVYVASDFNGGEMSIDNTMIVDGESNDIPLDAFALTLNPLVEVSSVWFEQMEMNLVEGDENWIFANIDPWDATDQNLVWSSSDESVAKVYTEDGRNAVIKAVNAGEATITATASNGISASCVVRVEKRFVDVWGIYLNQYNLNMTEGDSATLTATIDPADATDQTITWSSSDENLAVVKADGAEATVTALAPGYVEIYASVSNGMTATCYINVESRFIEVTGISFDHSELNLTEGDTAWLNATVSPDDATDKTLTWTSSDESVVRVSENGEVTAVAPGTATVTVTASNGLTASCNVNVEARFIEVTGISLDQSELNLTEGDTAWLNATVFPDDATDRTLTWTSSDESVVRVSENGEVTAVAPGNATVTVTSSNGMTTSCSVTVTARVIAVTEVVLDNTSLEMTEGDTVSLTATVNPADATDKTLTWTSSDASVASVSANGEVKALKAGTAIITVSSANGKTATCEVNVAKKIIEVTSVSLDQTKLELTEGDTATLTATVNPSDATDKTLTWTSSDASVASVSATGEVKALKEGTTNITVSSVNGKTATCVVTVAKKIIEVVSVSLDKTSLDMTEGDTATLTATVNPSDASDKTLTWTSSDTSVASVSVNGEVQALKAGTATITVSTANGKTATCVVTVEPKVIEMQSITLDAEELALEVGDTHQFLATVLPAETTYPELEWWTDDETVATVDQNGLLTMVGEGTTTVHVRSVRWPDIEAVCRLNVTSGVEGIMEEDAPCDIYTTNGKLLKQSVPTSEIRKLDRGLYIIRQRGKTTKLLK